MRIPYSFALLLCLIVPARAGNDSLDAAADLSRAGVLAGHHEGAGAAAARAFAEGTLASAAVVPVRASAGVKDRSAVLTHRAAAASGAVAVPQVKDTWNAKEKGATGFKRGFEKGFEWALTPAAAVGDLGWTKGSNFSMPNIFFLPATAAAIVLGIALLIPAALVGLARGAWGAVAGETRY